MRSEGVATNTSRLLGAERRKKILEILDKEDRVTVDELVKRFGVSAVTARADLDELAQVGALIRSHGGAIKRGDPALDYPVKFKETLHHAEKVRIGQAAARLVRPGQTIILDSGSTTLEIARQLRVQTPQALTVITNALNIAMELCNLAQVTVIMLGGIVRSMSYSLVGPHAEQALRDLNADQLFLGVDGLDPEVGPSTPDILEAQLNALMIRVSRETTVVADSSKFRRRSLSVIAKLGTIQRVITDDRADPAALTSLRNHGIEVVVV